MKTIAEQMSIYSSYHRDARNRATHFVGVPIIIFSILIPLSWLAFDFGFIAFTGATAVVATLIAYYVSLDREIGTAMIAVFLPLIAGAHAVAQMSTGVALGVFLVGFVGGWVIQFWGHSFEGRKPALFDNLFQIFVAPIFLTAEAFFALGFKKDMEERVDMLTEEHLINLRIARKNDNFRAAA